MPAATEHLLVGIDVGTTTSKAVVVTLDGVERSSGVRRTPWRRVPTGGEAAPEAILSAVVEAVRDALEAVPEGSVVGVGVTSMAETGLLLDVQGRPLLPAIAWNDRRAAADGDAMGAELGAGEVARRTGLKAGAKLTAATYRWLARHRLQTRAGRRWLSVAEWVVHALGGEAVAEASLASRTGWLDLDQRAWWPEAVAWSGIDPAFLPELRQAGEPMGTIRINAATRSSATSVLNGTALAPASSALDGAVLTVAGHDHQAAAIGAGVVEPADILNSCGTAEAFIRALAAPLDAPRRQRVVESGLSVGLHVLPDRQVLIAGFRSGDRLQALLDVLGSEGRAALDGFSPPDEDAWDENVLELTIDDLDALLALDDLRLDFPTSARLWRAATQSIARHGADLLDRMEALTGPHRRLVVVGGWGQGGQLAAAKDALLGPLERPPVGEAGARGAALLAGVAAGIYRDATAAPRPHRPEPGGRSGIPGMVARQ